MTTASEYLYLAFRGLSDEENEEDARLGGDGGVAEETLDGVEEDEEEEEEELDQ